MTTNVGGREVAVRDPIQQAQLPLWLLYPTAAAPRAERFGPYPIDLARFGAVAGHGLPLVVISHGTGGSPWVYRGLATHLVGAGCAVAMVEHAGNSRNDDALAGTDANLSNRPRHVRLAIDAAFAEPELGPRLASRVGVVGHSLGGYTALAAAGGRAMTLPADVVGSQRAYPDAETARRAYPVATERDRRIGAVALLAPALGWFLADGALADVDVPLLVRTGQRDPVCPPAQVQQALRSLPDPTRVDYAEVGNAGHFAFTSPFPIDLVRPTFPPSQDPPGFDRAAYQPILRAELTAFVRAALGATSSSP